MANINKKLDTNVAGEFYVDSTCINCDTCRQIAPSVFSEQAELSCVTKQPESPMELAQSWHALLACPVGSIGSTGVNKAKEYQSDFPLQVDSEVYYCGFNSRHSYGANSYFIKHDEGNWLIDAPRFQKSLIEKMHALGGVKYIFLSHRDDVADADRYAAEFKSQRLIHEDELSAQPGSEIILRGYEMQTFSPEFQIIPTPGHTKGHCVLLYKQKYLFTGDHLAFDRESKCLEVFEDYCWYSFAEQKQSVKKLLEYDFEWILPGHGQRVQLGRQKMKEKLQELCASFS